MFWFSNLVSPSSDLTIYLFPLLSIDLYSKFSIILLESSDESDPSLEFLRTVLFKVSFTSTISTSEKQLGYCIFIIF